MSAPRNRGPNNRLICLACRERRIRCELPDGITIPSPGELREVKTPCYRCQRLRIPCIVRATTLGRPRTKTKQIESQSLAIADDEDFRDAVLELPVRNTWLPVSASSVHQQDAVTTLALLPRQPQSSEAVLIMRAVDTIRCENCEESWPRHLVVRYGYTPALDLSVKAIVAACAYARGVPKLTPDDCYKALARALAAVQITMKQCSEPPNDDLLASTALLAPFEGVIKKNDIPIRHHIHGLAAILSARPAGYPVTQLARDVVNFYACDAAVMACVQGTPSAFESIDPAYYVSGSQVGDTNSDRAQLRGLADELFVRLPRLVMLVHTIRRQTTLQDELLSQALALAKSLLQLQDKAAEARLTNTAKARIRTVTTKPSVERSMSSVFQFASDLDFEAVMGYWQCRLSLLRLDQFLYEWHGVQTSSSAHVEITQLVQNIFMACEYATTLRLRKRRRLFAHAMVVVWEVVRDPAFAPEDDSRDAFSSCLVYQSVSTLRKHELHQWLEFVLSMSNMALAARPPLTTADMDVAAEIFAGGDPRGRFAELYGLYQ